VSLPVETGFLRRSVRRRQWRRAATVGTFVLNDTSRPSPPAVFFQRSSPSVATHVAGFPAPPPSSDRHVALDGQPFPRFACNASTGCGALNDVVTSYDDKYYDVATCLGAYEPTLSQELAIVGSALETDLEARLPLFACGLDLIQPAATGLIESFRRFSQATWTRKAIYRQPLFHWTFTGVLAASQFIRRRDFCHRSSCCHQASS